MPPSYNLTLFRKTQSPVKLPSSSSSSSSSSTSHPIASKSGATPRDSPCVQCPKEQPIQKRQHLPHTDPSLSLKVYIYVAMGAAQRLTTSPMEHQQADLDLDEHLMLKRSIACHPMFSLLKDAHLNCLKVCMGDEVDADREDREDCRGITTMGGCSELDLFMESYYLALVELKRAIREPMKEASQFIDFMQDLLLELSQPVLPMPSLRRGGEPVEAARVQMEKLEIMEEH